MELLECSESTCKRGDAAIALGPSSVTIEKQRRVGVMCCGGRSVVEMSLPFRGARIAACSTALPSGSGEAHIYGHVASGRDSNGPFAREHSLDLFRNEMGCKIISKPWGVEKVDAATVVLRTVG